MAQGKAIKGGRVEVTENFIAAYRDIRSVIPGLVSALMASHWPINCAGKPIWGSSKMERGEKERERKGMGEEGLS